MRGRAMLRTSPDVICGVARVPCSNIDGMMVVRRAALLHKVYGALVVSIGLISLPAGNWFAITTLRRARLWYTWYGFFCGLSFVVTSIIFADIFGRKALGRVNGVLAAVGTTTAGLGPLAFGWSRDTTGSYRPATTTCLTIFALAAGSLAARPLPTRPGVPKTASE